MHIFFLTTVFYSFLVIFCNFCMTTLTLTSLRICLQYLLFLFLLLMFMSLFMMLSICCSLSRRFNYLLLNFKSKLTKPWTKFFHVSWINYKQHFIYQIKLRIESKYFTAQMLDLINLSSPRLPKHLQSVEVYPLILFLPYLVNYLLDYK